jgi:hypothetical protein
MAWFDSVRIDADNVDLASTVRARALADKATLAEWVGIYDMDEADQALTIARELGDPALLVRALTACGCATVYDAEWRADSLRRRSAWPANSATRGGSSRYSYSRLRQDLSPARLI